MTQVTEKMTLRLKSGKTIRVKHVDTDDIKIVQLTWDAATMTWIETIK